MSDHLNYTLASYLSFFSCFIVAVFNVYVDSPMMNLNTWFRMINVYIMSHFLLRFLVTLYNCVQVQSGFIRCLKWEYFSDGLPAGNPCAPSDCHS